MRILIILKMVFQYLGHPGLERIDACIHAFLLRLSELEQSEAPQLVPSKTAFVAGTYLAVAS
jgi:hypothetical protein